MNRITGAFIIKAHLALTGAVDSLVAKSRQVRKDERGIEQVPLILLIAVGGAVIAGIIIAAITVFAQGQLAKLPQ